MATITSANSAFSLAIANLFPAPVLLQGYAADDAFSQEMNEMAEVQMGVDGIMTAGYVPTPVKQTINLQASSPSLAVFDAWTQNTRGSQDIFYATATIILPSIGRKYTLTKGVLTSVKPIPDAKKVLGQASYVITWQSVVGEQM